MNKVVSIRTKTTIKPELALPALVNAQIPAIAYALMFRTSATVMPHAVARLMEDIVDISQTDEQLRGKLLRVSAFIRTNPGATDQEIRKTFDIPEVFPV